MDKKIGERVRLARKAAGLTQEQLAEMTGYGHKTSINKIEKGLSGMSPEKLQAVCEALGVSPSYITTGIRVPGEKFPRKGWAEELVEAATKLSKARRIQLVEFCQFLTALDERDRENAVINASALTYRAPASLDEEPLVSARANYRYNPDTDSMELTDAVSVTYSQTHVEDLPGVKQKKEEPVG